MAAATQRAAQDATWLISRSTGRRGFWGLVGVLVFGWAGVAAIIGFVKAPHVDSGVLVMIALPFLVMAVVLALEGLGQGLVRVDEQGYRTILGRRRAWSDVLGVGTGQLEGQTVPVVAVRSAAGVPEQDSFAGFAESDAATLVDAFLARVDPAGFSSVALPESYWAAVEAEADRAASVVRAEGGREPLSRERVEFGFPGLPSAIRLDYGTNDAGEGVELLVRESTELALVASGRRWLRQNRKRSADPATQVAALFGPHTTTAKPSKGAGFDRLAVRPEGGRPLAFNAEEPDRFDG